MHLKKEIHIPIYKNMLWIILSDNMEEVQKLVPDMNVPYLFGHTVTSYDGRGDFIGVILNPKDAEFRWSIVAHEAAHAAAIILRTRGVDGDYKNDEPYAYLLEWIFEQIENFLDESKIKVKRSPRVLQQPIGETM
jgi:hypothetical protein